MSTTLTAPWLLPPNEAERLRTLHHYANPACLYEPVLSGFIDLAAQIFTLPIAFLSLVDAHEVTCKINLNPPQLVRLPRTASICALTVRLNAPLIFTDLTQQNQYGRLTTAAAATILAHGVQFYVSVPLRLTDQQPVGTLCLASHQPRSFSPPEQQVLEQIAELVAQTLVIRQICLASERLGEENWSNIQTTLTEDLWEFAALIRYLLQRSGTQEPVAPTVLAQAGRRLVELHSTLAVYPGSLP